MAWVDIDSNEVETNDWISTGVITKLCDNEQYNYDHGIRTGTDAVGYGVRLALARGRTYFEVSNKPSAMYAGSDDICVAGNITFATDSLDGDPHFVNDPDSLPTVLYTVEDYLEHPATDTYWYDDDIWIKQNIQAGENKWYIVPIPPKFIKTTGLTHTGFSYEIWFNTTARRHFFGYLNWIALGERPTGE